MVSNTIQFLFENKIYKIKNPDPNKTILDYVRDDLKKTGTKEGCAEGGCCFAGRRVSLCRKEGVALREGGC